MEEGVVTEGFVAIDNALLMMVEDEADHGTCYFGWANGSKSTFAALAIKEYAIPTKELPVGLWHLRA